jgi:hypothetical protein
MNCLNWASSRPGALALTTRFTPVIVGPGSAPGSIVTSARVWMVSGVTPALVITADSAMEKQPECAAASSSSGLVPFSSPKRVLKE